jgi:proteasome lid subunit RPN8/RPN11
MDNTGSGGWYRSGSILDAPGIDWPELLSPCLPLIFQHAEDEFPCESCGFVRASGVTQVTNVIDKIQWADLGQDKRPAQSGYALGIADTIALDQSFAGDDPVLVLYHSHPNGRAYFSDEDRRGAMISTTAVYPELRQLVVGVAAGRVREARLFEFRNGVDGPFAEVFMITPSGIFRPQ